MSEFIKNLSPVYQNLKLPLCPKCGDTKHVIDDPTESSKHVLGKDRYFCQECRIAWTTGEIVESDGTVHNLRYNNVGLRYDKNGYLASPPVVDHW